MTTKYEPHPISEYYAFPLMDGKDFDDLAASIKEYGQLDPIILLDGKILEGRNRYAACVALGIEVETEKYTDKLNPYEYVYIKNADRRHLTASQKIAAAAKRANAPHGGFHGNQYTEKVVSSVAKDTKNAENIVTAAQAAADAGVSVSQVDKAKAVLKTNAEAFKAIEDGKISVEAAYTATRKPKAEQGAALAAAIAKGPKVKAQQKTTTKKKKVSAKKTSPFQTTEFLKMEADAMAKVNAPSIYPEDAEWPIHPKGKIQTDYIQEAICELRKNEPDIWEMSWEQIFGKGKVESKIWTYTQRIQTYGFAYQSTVSGGAVGATCGPIDPRLLKWAENVANKARVREAYGFEKTRLRKAAKKDKAENPQPKSSKGKKNTDQTSIFGQKLKKLLSAARFTAADRDAVCKEAETVLKNYFEERWAEYAKSSGALKTNGATQDQNGQSSAPILQKGA
jgi:ParB-like chromosome segregation protein Spo0J